MLLACRQSKRVCVHQYHLTTHFELDALTHFELDALTHHVAALLRTYVYQLKRLPSPRTGSFNQLVTQKLNGRLQICQPE